ncbi:hypothetical protein ABZ370_04185 [Streptomyces sp. NPDC005962]|uniref:hypothetical protein n=1 Tax=Streptomyces sp. NPDC005962 TaxID=3154466 RepID=UPI0033C9B23F
MEIKILRVLDPGLGAVEFTCPAGHAWGFWKGDEEATVGVFHVELEISEPISAWLPPSYPHAQIKGEYGEDAQGVTISGTVERVDEDCVISFRIQSDVVLLETSQAAQKVTQGDFVAFTTCALELYPYEL